MSFWNLVWNLRGRPAARRSLGRPGLARWSFRPVLEALEDRCLPSTVTSLADTGPGSLRQAIADTAPGGTVDFDAGLAGIITLTSSPLTIAQDLTIAGPGAGVITVSGNHAWNVFTIANQVDVQISGLTIADALGMAIDNFGTLTVTSSTLSDNSAGNGGGIFNRLSGTVTLISSTVSSNSADQNGGGIYNQGTLTVTSSTLSGNSARGGAGGGIYNQQGAVTVTSSSLSGNSATDNGGGIYNQQATLTVSDSTLSGNSAQGSGGGINNSSGTVTVTSSTLSANSANAGGGIFNTVPGGGPGLTVTRSTLSGNTATNNGGGIYNQQAALTVSDSTLSGNSAGNGGGGIFHFVGTATIRNTIFASNTAPGSPDLSGSLNSQGHNLIGNTTGGSGFAASDLVGTADLPIDPLLGQLQDNGGPTFTMALLHGSPALNAGDTNQLGVADQRGAVRAGGVNIGAYQASASAFVLTVPATVTAGTPFDLTVTAVDPFGQTALGYTKTVQISSTDGQAALPVNYAFTLGDNGMHTFSNGVTLKTAGNETVIATDTVTGSITSSATVAVTPAAADHFLITIPDSVSSGTAFDVTITVVDAYGNTVPTYLGTVQFGSTDPDPCIILTPDYTFQTSDGGSHVFTAGITLITPGDETITVTDTGGGISGSVTVHL
jgi:hypothetical protein